MPKLVWAALAFLFLASCSEPSPTAGSTPTLRSTSSPNPARTATSAPELEPPTIPLDLSDVGVLTPTVPLNELTIFGFTYQKANGNRLAVGKGGLPVVPPVDIRLDGEPAWVVGLPLDGGASVWAVALADGQVQAFMVLEGAVIPVSLGTDLLPAGMPLMLVVHSGVPQLVTVAAEDASPLTHPVILGNDPQDVAYIAVNGDLVVTKDGETVRLEVDALSDARILQDPRGRLLVVTGASTRYEHGVLGDQIEGTSLTLVETVPEVVIANTISTGLQVFEGTAPLWCDLDDNGEWDIVATLSDTVDGARIVIFSEDGERLAEGPSAGRGYLWRHQLVAAPFTGGSSLTIVDNLTPHTGGISEYYNWDPEFGLNVISIVEGYSTHLLGSRNLDRVIAGDLDGDGLIEVMLPSQEGEILGAFRFLGNVANLAWTITLEADLTTNLAGVTLLDGRLAVGFGLASGILRLYIP